MAKPICWVQGRMQVVKKGKSARGGQGHPDAESSETKALGMGKSRCWQLAPELLLQGMFWESL